MSSPTEQLVEDGAVAYSYIETCELRRAPGYLRGSDSLSLQARGTPRLEAHTPKTGQRR